MNSTEEQLCRWKATCAYEGTDFQGWQSQVGGQTVQDFLEARLAEIFGGFIRIHGSGRTDSGVHARAQVFHFDAAWEHPEWKLLRALRTGLPQGIQVREIAQVSHGFHARFSAKGKRYCYQLFEGHALPWDTRYWWSLGVRKVDDVNMQCAAKVLIGEHDFTAFGANRADGSVDNPIKQMRKIDIERDGDRIIISLEASGFLYKMARSIVGALVAVGLGKLEAAELIEILESKQRTNRVQTAPAHGLWMDRVYY